MAGSSAAGQRSVMQEIEFELGEGVGSVPLCHLQGLKRPSLKADTLVPLKGLLTHPDPWPILSQGR